MTEKNTMCHYRGHLSLFIVCRYRCRYGMRKRNKLFTPITANDSAELG